MTRRIALLLPLVVCLCASCQTPEQRAVNMVLAHDGEITRDETLPDRPIVAVKFGVASIDRESVPSWLGHCPPYQLLCDLGSRGLFFFLSPFVEAGQKFAEVSWDCEFADIRGLTALRRLDLRHLHVTNGNLRAIRELKNLEYLNLAGTYITDASLKELKEFKGLLELDLNSNGLTDAGLKELKDLKSLKKINLFGNKFTRAGLEDLIKSLPDTLVCGWAEGTIYGH